jgi:hypothetical protein
MVILGACSSCFSSIFADSLEALGEEVSAGLDGELDVVEVASLIGGFFATSGT